MKLCSDHAKLCTTAIHDWGLYPLVEKKAVFNPLHVLHSQIYYRAVEVAGQYLYEQNSDGSNGGHYCPLCEFERNVSGFNTDQEVGQIVSEMAHWARRHHMIAQLH